MRILYVGHRYHTNQVPVMKGWARLGVKVLFMSQYCGKIEDNDSVENYVMKESLISKVYYFRLKRKYKPSDVESRHNKYFIPSVIDIFFIIKKFNPDLIIIRGKTIGNAFVVAVCRLLGKKNIIIYDQSPLYYGKIVSGWKSSLLCSLFPKVSFTPILYVGKERNIIKLNKRVSCHFVPLICEALLFSHKYSDDGIIRILDVGKFRDYKNHFFLIDALSSIQDKKKYKVTIMGQLQNSDEIEYYNRLCQYVKNKNLEDVVLITGDVSFCEMDNIYAKHDVLVLPSKHESAGMVILEAMAHGLCVLSSENCGLSSYVDSNNCGFVFGISDPIQLSKQLESLAHSPEKIIEFGDKARKIVSVKYSFRQYLHALNDLTESSYKYNLLSRINNKEEFTV